MMSIIPCARQSLRGGSDRGSGGGSGRDRGSDGDERDRGSGGGEELEVC